MSNNDGVSLGLDFDGSRISAVALDSQGQALAERRVAMAEGNARGFIATSAELVAALESDLGQSGLAVGMSTPGSLHPITHRLRGCHIQALNQVAIGRDLSAAIGRDVRMANDADCLAVSEGLDGAGLDEGNVCAVVLGAGIGGGLLINGQPLVGRHAMAGEWGHNSLPWPTSNEIRQAPRCRCGQAGCIEAWLSAPGISADHLRRGGHKLTAHDIVARAEGGERLAGATLRDWLARLARAFAMVINLLDPDVIVCGGSLSQIRWLYSEIPKIWGNHVLTDVVETRLLPAAHGDLSSARGAALVARDLPRSTQTD